MGLIFIDSESESRMGGGIRTYIQLMLSLCREQNMTAEVLTHNPEGYPGFTAHPIQRQPIKWPLVNSILYRFFYPVAVRLEYSNWLKSHLSLESRKNFRMEFCDFGGYAFFSLQTPKLRKHITIKIHTPEYLIRSRKITGKIQQWIELYCLRKALRVTCPSRRFVQEKLPEFAYAEHIPNPLPELNEEFPVSPGGSVSGFSLLYIGRIEERKGTATLIQAVAGLKSLGIRFTLTLAGKWAQDDYSRHIENLIANIHEKENYEIVSCGECSKQELKNLLHRHKICLIPSLWENSPYAYWEAIREGTLTIGTNTGEMESFQQSFLPIAPKAGDPESLCKLLEGLSKSPEELSRLRTAQRKAYVSYQKKSQELNRAYCAGKL